MWSDEALIVFWVFVSVDGLGINRSYTPSTYENCFRLGNSCMVVLISRKRVFILQITLQGTLPSSSSSLLPFRLTLSLRSYVKNSPSPLRAHFSTLSSLAAPILGNKMGRNWTREVVLPAWLIAGTLAEHLDSDMIEKVLKSDDGEDIPHLWSVVATPVQLGSVAKPRSWLRRWKWI
jgi:hypothetical protein